MKKKIIFSNYDDIRNPYYAGGGAVAIHETSKRLCKDYDVHVITGAYPGCKSGIIDGVMYERIGVGFTGPILGQLLFQLSLPIKITASKFDIWIESFTPPFSTACLQLFSKKPVIGLVHSLSGENSKRKYHLPFDILEKVGIKTYKNFIVTTRAFKSLIENINKKASISVIPNGITKTYSKKLNHLEKYLLFLGRIEIDQKGLDLLINAYSLLETKNRIQLMIAGSGTSSEAKKLRTLIKNSGLENSIKLVGRVEGKQKHNLLRKALCVVIPSRFEAFSIVALESISYAKPMVTFDIDGLSWIPKKSRVIASSISERSLARSLSKVISSKKLRVSMSLNSMQAARLFSWDEIASKYKQVISKILS